MLFFAGVSRDQKKIATMSLKLYRSCPCPLDHLKWIFADGKIYFESLFTGSLPTYKNRVEVVKLFRPQIEVPCSELNNPHTSYLGITDNSFLTLFFPFVVFVLSTSALSSHCSPLQFMPSPSPARPRKAGEETPPPPNWVKMPLFTGQSC